MATLKYAIPGVGGSLGSCAICGEAFVRECILGESVSGLRIGGFSESLPVHDKCADLVVNLQGSWEEIRANFPKGPMYDCFEEEFQSGQTAKEGK